MYRQLFVLLCAFGLVTPAAFASSAKAFSEALNHAAVAQQPLKMQHSALSHEKGVIPIKILVGAHVDSEYANNDPLVKECPAVRISSHYLLASMACVGLSEYGTIQHYMGAGSGPMETRHKVSRWIEKAYIDGETISKENIQASKDNKVFLVRIDPKNAKLKAAVENKPAANLFVPKDPQKLKDTFSKVKINREELCTSDRECAEVEIINVCTETGCFKLGWKWIDGDSGDPIFGLLPDTTTEEFLLGFNATDVDVTNRQSGRYYFFFPSTLADFLQKSIQKKSPADWQQIKRKMVDEYYFTGSAKK